MSANERQQQLAAASSMHCMHSMHKRSALCCLSFVIETYSKPINTYRKPIDTKHIYQHLYKIYRNTNRGTSKQTNKQRATAQHTHTTAATSQRNRESDNTREEDDMTTRVSEGSGGETHCHCTALDCLSVGFLCFCLNQLLILFVFLQVYAV